MIVMKEVMKNKKGRFQVKKKSLGIDYESALYQIFAN